MKVHNMFLPAAMLVGGGVSTAFAIAGAANDAPAASIAGLALFGVTAAASVVAGVGLIAIEQGRRA